MTAPVVVAARGVSKAYRLYERPQDRLKDLLFGRWRSWHRDYPALQDVSFEIRRGESVALIGRNGSGKSTLLQIVAGTLMPSAGTVDVAGRVCALLELGSGFNTEFSGRENVYMNASILGISREETEHRFDRIVEFAELGEFIDQPVKTYSSGMMMRLAFAVQAFTDPDLLIIDEALAVGDVFFQQKCFRHLRGLRERGVTLLFVSHDMASVRNLCSRALLLKSGRLVFDGEAPEAASRYFSFGHEPLGRGATVPAAEAGSRARLTVPDMLRESIIAHDVLPRARGRHGDGGLRLLAARVRNEHGDDNLQVQLRREVTITVLVRAERTVMEPAVGLHLFDRHGTLVFAAGSRQLGVVLPTLAAGDEFAVQLRLTLDVTPGQYTFSLGAGEPSPEGPNVGVTLDRHEGLGPLQVTTDPAHMLPFHGLASLPLSIERLEVDG